MFHGGFTGDPQMLHKEYEGDLHRIQGGLADTEKSKRTLRRLAGCGWLGVLSFPLVFVWCGVYLFWSENCMMRSSLGSLEERPRVDELCHV